MGQEYVLEVWRTGATFIQPQQLQKIG